MHKAGCRGRGVMGGALGLDTGGGGAPGHNRGSMDCSRAVKVIGNRD